VVSSSVLIIFVIIHTALMVISDVPSHHSSATAFLTQVAEIAGNYEGEVFDALPNFKLSSLFFAVADLFDFTELGTKNLNVNFVFFEESRLELQHRSDALRNRVNSSKVVCQNEVVVLIRWFYQAYVLNVIFEGWHRFDN